MDEEMRSHRANDLLHVSVLEDACAAGCRTYYLGESGWSDNLARYKERLGAQRYDYAEYRRERLPITRGERVVKGAVKRVVGFKDFEGTPDTHHPACDPRPLYGRPGTGRWRR